MTQSAQELLARIPLDHELADGVCTACGFNLRGLTRRARCPECAASVDASLLAAFAGPKQHARAERGRSRARRRPLMFIVMLIIGLGFAVLFATVALPK